MERVIPASNANEREMLEAWIDFHRATLAMKCDGLGPDDLRRRSAEPSALSLLGLVRHLAEVERSWFRHTFLGEAAPPIWYTADSGGSEFDVADADVAEAFRRWQEECAHSREVVARARNLDVASKEQPYDKPITLRWIMTHMIEEYARHNGHADLLRERIDGATGV
jgi:uncharacterized damage-inducible protein DinB